MEYSDNNIDRLFLEKFESFRIELKENDWHITSLLLTRYNFLKFALLRFNIYYLSAIITFGSLSTYTIFKNKKINSNVKQPQQTIQQYNNEPVNISTSQDTIPREVKNNGNKEESQKKSSVIQNKTLTDSSTQTKVNQHNESISINNSAENTSIKSQKDTAQKLNSTIVTTDTSTKRRVKTIKKVIVIKPHNVIVKDTVQIYRIHK